MAGPRLSIRALASVVAVFGMGFAALRSGSPAWYQSIYNLTVLALGIAVIAARRRGVGGTFWLGFAAFGWAYFVASFGQCHPHIYPAYSDDGPISANPNPDLWTTGLVERGMSIAYGIELDFIHSSHAMNVNAGDLIRRVAIAHLLLCSLLGLFGGIVARFLVGTEGD